MAKQSFQKKKKKNEERRESTKTRTKGKEGGRRVTTGVLEVNARTEDSVC